MAFVLPALVTARDHSRYLSGRAQIELNPLVGCSNEHKQKINENLFGIERWKPVAVFIAADLHVSHPTTGTSLPKIGIYLTRL